MAFTSFTAGANYLMTNNPPITTNPMSIFAFGRRRAGTTAVQNIMQLCQAASPATNVNRILTVANTEELRVATVDVGGTSTLTHTTATSGGAWNLLGGIWYDDGFTRDVVINTSVVTGTGVALGQLPIIDRFSVGISGSATNPWLGDLCQVAVWNVPLTQDDINDLNKGVSPIFVRRDNLVAYYPLTDHFNDVIGGYNLLQTGTLDTASHVNIFNEQNVVKTKDRINKAVKLDLHFTLTNAIETQWEFTMNGNKAYITTTRDGTTQFSNVLSSGIDNIKLQLSPGQEVTVRVRQKTAFGWQGWMNEMSVTAPYYNSYDRYLELTGQSPVTSDAVDSTTYGSGTGS